ncbi:MAG: EcsC family protein [Pseudomonadota bacterium]
MFSGKKRQTAEKAEQKADHGMILKTLDYCYEKAVSGMPGFETAEQIARHYMDDASSPDSRVQKLIRSQIAKAATSGFVTGLGGILTLPIAVPANISSVLYVQIRMIAALAFLAGYDLRDEKVKPLVYVCLCGNDAKMVINQIGIQAGTNISAQTLFEVSGANITKINRAVSLYLMRKLGQTGAASLGKAVPLIGGIIGGTVDSISTKNIGAAATKIFVC